ncbi:hypothetical protein HKX48_005646 [Thoreauomyces humboldtii]|nr:hypothetical protein HKX48_005646 [Thoreauomyces humboldtii]
MADTTDRRLDRTDELDSRSSPVPDHQRRAIHHPTVEPKQDPWKTDAEYVEYEKAGIEGQHDESYDEEDDAIARAINSVAPQEDDPTLPVLTFRSVFLGTLWGIVLCVANSIFSFRTVTLLISVTIVILLAYPMGHAMAKILPRSSFNAFGQSWSLNPGPFNAKEHVVLGMIASAMGSQPPYGIDNVVAQRLAAGQAVSFGSAIPWVLCTQMIGFGFAGVLRRFVVWPREMPWPSNYSLMALYASFWGNDDAMAAEGASKYKMSRYTFFWIAVICCIGYEFLPQYIFNALQTVSLLCWFSKDAVARNYGSATYGFGYLTLTFDWNYITSTFMTTPFWVTCLMLSGNIFWTWIMVPILNAGNHPGSNAISAATGMQAINDSGLYTLDGALVAKTHLYNLPEFTVNHTYIETAGPFVISNTFYMSYVQSFFNLSATLSHCFLWYGPQLKRQTIAMFRQEGRESHDVHNELMRAYKEVPEWFYALIALVFFIGMILTGELTIFKMPWWSVFVATAVVAVFIIPIAIINAITGMQIGLNVITEFIAGLALPGNVVAVMCFKSYGYNTMIQALSLLSDLKLGHYLHIGPRTMLFTQMYGTVIGAFISTGVCLKLIDVWGPTSMGGNGTLDPHQGDWKSVSYYLFFNAAAIWGAIGPRHFFGDAYGNKVYIGFALGGKSMLGKLGDSILPVAPWLANRYRPSRWWIYMNFAVFSMAIGNWQIGNPQNYTWSVLVVAFVSQFYLFRNHFAWWSKYNYVLGAGLDAGLAVAIIIITLVNMSHPAKEWAGNAYKNAASDYYCQGTNYAGN